MLWLHCTARLAESLGVERMPAPDPDGLDWLDCWYVRDVSLRLPLDALLFTNAATLYSPVLPFDRRERVGEIVAMFGARLVHVAGHAAVGRLEPFRVCRTASRRIVGCMNDLALTITYEAERQAGEDGVRFETIEDRLNEGVVGGLFPKAVFQRRLGGFSSDLGTAGTGDR